MTDLQNSTATVAINASIKGKGDALLQERIRELVAKATEADRAAVLDLIDPGKPARVVSITPEMAAIVLAGYNKHNRDLGYLKASQWGDAMRRLEWQLSNQGVGFYADGNISDGQHRMGGVALSGTTQQFLVMTNLPSSVAKAIDRGTPRTAGHWFALAGIPDGKFAAAISGNVIDYENERAGKKKPLSPDQMEAWYLANTAHVRTAIGLVDHLDAKHPHGPLTKTEAGSIALAMYVGGYPESVVISFLGEVMSAQSQHGADAPTMKAAVRFLKAQNRNANKDRLSRAGKMALAAKAAALFAVGSTPLRLDWKPKEGLPSFAPPIGGDIPDAFGAMRPSAPGGFTELQQHALASAQKDMASQMDAAVSA